MGELKYGLIPTSLIEVGERARTDNGDITDIVESAKTEVGQIQSIAVVETDNEEKPYRLVAGGRRFVAFQQAGKQDVLVRIYPKGTTEETLLEIELLENVARLDMTWQDRVATVKKIHSIRIQKHGQKISPKDNGWTQEKTAALVGKSTASISRDLELSEALENNPELRKCKTKDEAVRLNDRLREKAILEELAKRAEEKIVITPRDELNKNMIDAYHVVDTFEFMRGVKPFTYDVVECDPDYGINFDGFLKKQNTMREAQALEPNEYKAVQVKDYPIFMRKLIMECHRVLKPNGWLLMWHSPDWAGLIWKTLVDVGFKVAAPIIWNKGSGGMTMNPDTYLGRGYECMFYARKGRPALLQRGKCDVITFPRDPAHLKSHPAEKPVKVMEWIYELFAAYGHRVLVPFLGSGNSIIACTRLGVQVEGCDLSQLYKDKFVAKVMASNDALLNPEYIKKLKTNRPPAHLAEEKEGEDDIEFHEVLGDEIDDIETEEDSEYEEAIEEYLDGLDDEEAYNG